MRDILFEIALFYVLLTSPVMLWAIISNFVRSNRNRAILDEIQKKLDGISDKQQANSQRRFAPYNRRPMQSRDSHTEKTINTESHENAERKED